MATRTISDTGGNWNATGTWVEGVVPTDQDDVVAQGDGTSGPLTMNANGACRTIDFTNYTSTFTFNNQSYTLSVGNTGGGSGTAFKFVSGMTVTSGTDGCGISFVSTSGPWDVYFAGKTIGGSTSNITFNGAGGSWVVKDNLPINGYDHDLYLTAGTLTIDNAVTTVGSSFNFYSTGTATRVLNMGTATWNIGAGQGVWNVTNTGLTINCGTSKLMFTGSNITFNGAGFTYYDATFNYISSSMTLNGANTFHDLTLNSAYNLRESIVNLADNQTVTGTLSVYNLESTTKPWCRMLVASSTYGTPKTLSVTTMGTMRAVDFRDITASGSASWNLSAITSGSGDCGGNSGITFTTPITVYWYHGATALGNWSGRTGTSADNRWYLGSGGTGGAARRPLAQDTAVFDSSSFPNTGLTLDIDVGKACSVNLTNATNSPTITCTGGGAENTHVLGDFILKAGLPFSSGTIYLDGGPTRSGYYTLNTAGITMLATLYIYSIGCTYTLQSDLVLQGGTNVLYLRYGALDGNGKNVTASYFDGSASTTRSLKMGSGTWTFNGSATNWYIATATNMVLHPDTSTIVMAGYSTSNRQFYGGGFNYNILKVQTTGTGTNTIYGSNSFNEVYVNPGRTLYFEYNKTTTINRLFNATGLPGILTTIASSSTSFPPPMLFKTFSDPVDLDYISLAYITAGPGEWYAGDHSTIGSYVYGWRGGSSKCMGKVGVSPIPSSSTRINGTKVRGSYKKINGRKERAIFKFSITTTTTPQTFTLPLGSSPSYKFDMTVDWGDNTPMKFINAYNSPNIAHSYATAGTYTVTLKGWCQYFAFNNAGDKALVKKIILHEGDMGFVIFNFYGATTLNTVCSLGDVRSMTDASYLLNGCGSTTGMRDIPPGLLDGCTEVTNMSYALGSEYSTRLPPDLFKYNRKVTNMTGVLYNETQGVGAVPSGLFDYNTKVTDFTKAFQWCGQYYSMVLPSGLFKNCHDVTTFRECFGNCYYLLSVPDDLFRYNPHVTDFTYTFTACWNMPTIPQDLFRYNTAATNFVYTLHDCSDLTAIPTDLFRYNTAATSFAYCFDGCNSLTSIPTDLFRYNTSATLFYYTFSGCTGLTTIPTDIFRYNTSATNFEGVFYGCNHITAIPTDLFRYNTSVAYFYWTFYGDSAISQALDGHMLDYCPTTARPKAMFQNCTGLTGGGWQDIINHITGTTDHTLCFNGCTGLTGYPASIPTSWGGTGSG